jgi:hypothetical protein
MANLVFCDAGISARLALGAVGLRLRAATAQASAHEGLAGIAGHPGCLRIAVLHSLCCVF